MSMNNTDTAKPPQSASEATETAAGPQTLYDSLLERFRVAAGEGPEAALQRYGFALFHSLLPEEQLLLKEELGIKCQNAADYYNLGVAYAAKEQYEQAISCWTQALKMDSDLADAHCNLAVAHERLMNLGAARTHYKRYLDAVDNAEEIERVTQHLAELGS